MYLHSPLLAAERSVSFGMLWTSMLNFSAAVRVRSNGSGGECEAPFYSITWVACASSDDGIVTPSDRAVLRFTAV